MAAVSGSRIACLDEIRGFCILCMVFYHAFYLFGSMGSIEWMLRLYRFFSPVQLLFASVFICISGICTNFSRSAVRRGLILLGIAVCISLLTVVWLPRWGLDGFQDKFGILHLLACCMLLASVVNKLSCSVKPLTGIVICILLYMISAFFLSGRVDLTEALSQNRFLFPLGLHTDRFYSADYFPLLPHMFVFFGGMCIGKSICARELPASAFRTHVRFFAFFGRHSLAVYLLHVPCLLLILYIIERI